MHTLVMTFEDRPDTALRIRTNANVQPEDIDAVELIQSHRITRSSFWTSTAGRTHMVPMLERSTCPLCGVRAEQRVPPEQIAVHVIGPVTLTAEQEEELEREIASKVRRYGWGWRCERLGQYGRQPDDEQDEEAACHDPADVPAADAPDANVPSFELRRNGRRVASIPAQVLEEAASKCSAMAKALGWNEYEIHDPQETPRDGV